MGWGLSDITSAAIEFTSGVANAVVSNTLSISNATGSQSVGFQRETGRTGAFAAGQTVGDAISVAQGIVEIAAGVVTAAAGGAGEIVTAGGATPVAVPVIAAGVAVTSHGAVTLTNAVNNITKPPTGKGSVSPDQRDPKRVYSKNEKQEMLDDQGGNCAQCGESKTVDEVQGHHVQRHADGGQTTKDNGAAVCTDCHKDLHSK